MSEKYIKMAALNEYPFRRNHYDREHGNRDFIAGVESVMEFADYLPTYTTAEIMAQQWVPVTERLPRPGEDVLVWSKEFDVCVAHIPDGCTWFTDGDITHWMELPRPPIDPVDLIDIAFLNDTEPPKEAD